MEVLFEGFYHEHISKHVLKIHAFCKTAANFRRYFLNSCFEICGLGQ